MQIIRSLWGDGIGTNPVITRRSKINDDILQTISIPHSFITYCFGTTNYDQATKNGLDCVKMCDDPYMFDGIKETYRHKLEAIRTAIIQYKCDILYLDWDCIPNLRHEASKRSYVILERFNPKGCLSANLMMYNKPKCYWRSEAWRTIPNGGFLFVRDLETINGIIEEWEGIRNGGFECNNDEVAIAKYLDRIHDGWMGNDKYKELYEPNVCSLNRKGIWLNPNAELIHYLGNSNRRFN